MDSRVEGDEIKIKVDEIETKVYERYCNECGHEFLPIEVQQKKRCPSCEEPIRPPSRLIRERGIDHSFLMIVAIVVMIILGLWG